MTSEYFLWLDSIAQRDATLVALAMIAVYLVLPWVALDWAGRHWSPGAVQFVRWLFIGGGIAVYVLTVVVSGSTTV